MVTFVFENRELTRSHLQSKIRMPEIEKVFAEVAELV
jgi:hypothetical protein